MKELPKEIIAELEREAKDYMRKQPFTVPVRNMNEYNTGYNAWLSCAKEYELKLMEKEERINELIMADMTHEYNQAEAENFRHEYERQLLEPLQEKVNLLRSVLNGVANLYYNDIKLNETGIKKIEQTLKQTE
jgi:hypothetical protein